MRSFGFYWPGDSFLHRMDPRAKLLAFFAIALAVFWKPYLFSIFFILVFILCLGKLAGFWASWLFSGFSAFLFIFLLGCVSILLQKSGMGKIFLMGGRLAVFLVSANLFSLTTSPFQVGQAVRKLFGSSLGFSSLLVFRFLPLLEEERAKIMRAQVLRGIPLDSRNLLKKIQAYPALLIPLFVLSFQKAEKISTAMLLRSFSSPFSGKPLREIHWRFSDTLFLTLFFAAVLLFCFLPEHLPPIFRYPYP
jgi:energy-coupling factor transport system permease protein